MNGMPQQNAIQRPGGRLDYISEQGDRGGYDGGYGQQGRGGPPQQYAYNDGPDYNGGQRMVYQQMKYVSNLNAIGARQ